MRKTLTCGVMSGLLLATGCANVQFYAEDGQTELPGFPFYWKDERGQPNLAYAKTNAGIFASGTFAIATSPDGMSVGINTNQDVSFGSAEDAGVVKNRTTELSEKILFYDLGRRSAVEKMRTAVSALPDSARRAELLAELDSILKERVY